MVRGGSSPDELGGAARDGRAPGPRTDVPLVPAPLGPFCARNSNNRRPVVAVPVPKLKGSVWWGAGRGTESSRRPSLEKLNGFRFAFKV